MALPFSSVNNPARMSEFTPSVSVMVYFIQSSPVTEFGLTAKPSGPTTPEPESSNAVDDDGELEVEHLLQSPSIELP